MGKFTVIVRILRLDWQKIWIMPSIEFTTWQHPASVILKATEQTTGQFMLVNWPFTCKGKGNRVNVLDC